MRVLNQTVILGLAATLITGCTKKSSSLQGQDAKVNLDSESFFKGKKEVFTLPENLPAEGFFPFEQKNGKTYFYSRSKRQVRVLDNNQPQDPGTTIADFSQYYFTGTECPVLTKNDEIIIIDRRKIYSNSGNRAAELNMFYQGHLYAMDVDYLRKAVYDETTNSIYLHVNVDDEELPDNYRTLPTVAKIDLNTNTFSTIQIPYPNNYREDINYGLADAPMIAKLGRKLVVAYGLSNEVWILDLDNNSITQQTLNLPLQLTNPLHVTPATSPGSLFATDLKNKSIYSVSGNDNNLFVLCKGSIESANDKFYDKCFLTVYNRNLEPIYQGKLNVAELEDWSDARILEANNTGVVLHGHKHLPGTNQHKSSLATINF